MGATIIDVETTGITDPDVIELAYIGPLEFRSPARAATRMRFKPRKPISIGALATHHILDEDLVNETPWPGFWAPPWGTDYVIGHSVDFDWKAIGAPGDIRRICTLALARALWPELESHSLGALTYQFNNRQDARTMLKNAHDAAADAGLCCLLLVHIFAQLTVSSWEELWQQSEIARVPTRFTFGKYGPEGEKKGRLIADIRREDPGYIRWCLGVPDFYNDPYLSRALRGQV